MSVSAAMSEADFEKLTTVTIGELGMGIMLLRDGSLSVEKLAENFSGYCRCVALPTDVRALYTRMVERQLVAVDPKHSRLIQVTKEGHDLLLASFTALIRLVDEGHGALEISLLFSLASRRLSHDQED